MPFADTGFPSPFDTDELTRALRSVQLRIQLLRGVGAPADFDAGTESLNDKRLRAAAGQEVASQQGDASRLAGLTRAGRGAADTLGADLPASVLRGVAELSPQTSSDLIGLEEDRDAANTLALRSPSPSFGQFKRAKDAARQGHFAIRARGIVEGEPITRQRLLASPEEDPAPVDPTGEINSVLAGQRHQEIIEADEARLAEDDVRQQQEQEIENFRNASELDRFIARNKARRAQGQDAVKASEQRFKEEQKAAETERKVIQARTDKTRTTRETAADRFIQDEMKPQFPGGPSRPMPSDAQIQAHMDALASRQETIRRVLDGEGREGEPAEGGAVDPSNPAEAEAVAVLRENGLPVTRFNIDEMIRQLQAGV